MQVNELTIEQAYKAFYELSLEEIKLSNVQQLKEAVHTQIQELSKPKEVEETEDKQD